MHWINILWCWQNNLTSSLYFLSLLKKWSHTSLKKKKKSLAWYEGALLLQTLTNWLWDGLTLYIQLALWLLNMNISLRNKITWQRQIKKYKDYNIMPQNTWTIMANWVLSIIQSPHVPAIYYIHVQHHFNKFTRIKKNR